MLNLLRAELFKLWRSKVLWVIVAVMTGIFFLLISFSYLAETGVIEESDSFRIEVNDVATEETPLSGVKLLIETVYGPDVFSIVLIISFLGAFFLAQENSTGTIKNAIATGHQRWQIYITKMFALIIGSILLTITFMLLPIVAGSIFFGFGELPDKDTLMKTGKILMISWLYYMSFASITTLFSILSRGSGIALLFSIGYYLLAGAGLRFLGMQYKIWEKVNEYSIYYLFTYVGERVYEEASLLTVIVMPLVTMFIFTCIGILTFQRKDIQ